MYRADGSFVSANAPTLGNQLKQPMDHALYRCLVVDVIYADNPLNISKNAPNPRALYNCVVLGGQKSGEIFSFCRLQTAFAGPTAHQDFVLQKTTKPIKGTQLKDHDGAVVYIQFIQGDTRFPVITGGEFALGPLDLDPNTEENSPNYLSSFNGVKETIDNVGDFKTEKAGGVTAEGIFTLNKADPLVTIESTANAYKIATDGLATLNLSAALVAIGVGDVEVLKQLSDALQELITLFKATGATHVHICNLGYPSSVPISPFAANWTAAGDALQVIKDLIDGITGTL